MFKECYALEKIHGTSAHISYVTSKADSKRTLSFFSGGESHEKFVKLFNVEELTSKFESIFLGKDITVYGEAYGGKQQGMSATYGKELKFIVFDVCIGDKWLDVPTAESIAKALGLEFVHYVKCSTSLEVLDYERDFYSVQAARNGMGTDKMRESVVLRPPIEVTLNNGNRIISKHKRKEFMETATPRSVETDPEKLKVLSDAQAIADEWVTMERMKHVVSKLGDVGMEQTKQVIDAMVEDVLREGTGEIVDSPEARKAIGRNTAKMLKEYLEAKLKS